MIPRLRVQSGFTLLEVLLALAAFAILSVTVITVYLSSGRVERQGLARQREVGSAQFLLEEIVKDVRLSSPDYEYYAAEGINLSTGGVVNPVNSLALTFTDNSHRYYRCWAHHQWLDATGAVFQEKWDWCERPYTGIPVGHTSSMVSSTIIKSDQSAAKCINNVLADPPCTVAGLPISVADWAQALIENITVNDFRVYIMPSTDPFLATASDIRQPLTTVAITIEGTGKIEEKVRTTFQTTASSRTYAR